MKKCIAITLLLSAASGAFAATAYDSQAEFLANTQGGYYLEDFGAPAETDDAPPSFSNGTYTWTARASSPWGDLCVWGDDIAYGTPCVGSMGTTNWGDAIIIEFTGAPVTAFGGNLYMTDIDFLAIDGQLTVALDDGTSVTLQSPYATSFTGFTSRIPITSVTLTPDPNSLDDLYANVDNIVVGTAVPEPTTLTLLAIAGLAIRRHRRP